jgi:hypothetical protein
MPSTIQSNPYGIDAAQGNVVYTDRVIAAYAADPYGSVATISSVTAANPGVWTTSAAHGFITGQQIVLGYVAGYTPSTYANVMTGAGNNAGANGLYTVTVLSATTFSVPFNTTGGTLGTAGKVAQAFQIGQAVALQGWNGTVSSNTAASAFPTVGLTPITTANFGGVGIIIGGNAPGSPPLPPTTGPYGGVLQVMTAGICPAYYDTTTTVLSTSNASIASVARPGCLKAASPSVGLTFGTALQAVTVTNAYNPQLAQTLIQVC